MSIGNYSNFESVFGQELTICSELLKEDKFDTLNMMGNRIMENSLFSDDFRYFLAGYFIKEMSLVYQKVFSSTEPRAFQTSKIIGNELINSIADIFKEEINEDLLWEKFHLFNVKIQEYLRDTNQQKFYQENHEFSELVIKQLLKFLKENEVILYLKFNQFFAGIINVLERIFRAHSGRVEFTLVLSYIKSLDRLYDYLLVKYDEGETLDNHNLKREIHENIEFICDEGIKEKIDISEYDKFLWQIIAKWRKFHIYYMNITPPRFTEKVIRKKIELPEETKKVIEESLKQAIEKKL